MNAKEVTNKQPVKNTFQDDADDSSEEESVVKDVTAYNVNGKWQQYANSKNTIAEKDETTRQAFITHAYGLKLLYNPKTNAEYYPLKKSALGKNQFSNETVWFYFALTQVFDEIKQRITTQNIDFSQYQQHYSSTIDQWSQQLKELIRPLLMWLRGKPATQNLDILFKNIFQSFYAFFSSFFPNHELLYYFVIREICPSKVKQAINSIKHQFSGMPNQDNLSLYYTNIPIELRKILEIYALDQALNYLRDLGALQSDNMRPLSKELRKKLQFAKNIKYPSLGVVTEKWYKHKNLSGKSRMDNYLNNPYHLKELVIALILDFAVTKNNTNDLKEQAHKEFMELCVKYLSLACENPLYRPFIERTLLPTSCSLTSTNPYTFFAQLRLSQQDMRRRQKQLLDDRYNEQETIIGSSYCRIWKFNSSCEAIETQDLTANQKTKVFSRNDKIISFGNYPEISVEIEAIKKMINNTPLIENGVQITRTSELLITDAKIAEWVRKTLQGAKISDEFINYRLTSGHFKKIELCIINLTYLLFGCEGSRNPASLTLHQMMLDLIIYSNYTWQQMCNNTFGVALIPMAMTYAVPSARVLHEKFQNFMPYPYQYFGSEQHEKAEELLRKRYPILINTWLIYYLKEPQKDLEEAIKNSLLRWYNISPQELEYQQIKLN